MEDKTVVSVSEGILLPYRFGWFRLFGRGLKWKDTLIHGLTFSERNGYKKGLQLGKWRIGYLPCG